MSGPVTGSSELENQMAAQIRGRAWSFLTLERTARLAAGQVAYGDELGVRYVYDSHVPHHAEVQVGDLAVIRDDKVVLGAGRIDAIDTGTGLKVRQRCPTCRSTSYKFRTRAVIPFRCSDCGTEFAETDKTDVSAVQTYAADYSRTWSPANTLFPVTAITNAYVSHAAQHSIRQLEPDALRPILQTHLVPDIWWTQDGPDTELGGGFAIVLGKTRLGQQRFREEMLGRFGPRCAFTGPQPPEALEAAHVRSYSTSPRHDRANGLILRRDLHTLFDRRLITIDPDTWTIDVAPALSSYPDIAHLQGRPLDVPDHLRPRRAFIEEHAATSRAEWQQSPANVAELRRN